MEMPTFRLTLSPPPTFEYELSEDKVAEMTDEELTEHLIEQADIDIAEGAGYYGKNDWDITCKE